MTCRPVVDVATPPGGWGLPWPNVAEIEAALPCENWTLVGGLMTQLHAVHAGIDVIRPTNDVDIVLHLETTRGVAATAATALEGLGGTQALRRTVNARLTIADDRVTTISVPDVFCAVVLKAAAYRTDSRDPGRHLRDAASLLCCLVDPFAERERFTGSDLQRLRTLRLNLPDGAPAWSGLPVEHRRNGQAALRILTA